MTMAHAAAPIANNGTPSGDTSVQLGAASTDHAEDTSAHEPEKSAKKKPNFAWRMLKASFKIAVAMLDLITDVLFVLQAQQLYSTTGFEAANTAAKVSGIVLLIAPVVNLLILSQNTEFMFRFSRKVGLALFAPAN